jgi:hypothetical protein
MFIKMIFENLNVKITLPIIVNVDNMGAIYLAKNAGSTGRTQHIDTHYHYVREYIEDRIIQIKFIKSEENDADIFTKNLN